MFLLLCFVSLFSTGLRYASISKLHRFQHQHDQVLQYAKSWNGHGKARTGYHHKASKLKVRIGNRETVRDDLNKTFVSLKPEINIRKKFFDDFNEIYPYAKALQDEEAFQSISFYDEDIGDFVRDSESENFVFDKEDPRQFNVTVDIAYEVQREGSLLRTNKVVQRIPIFQKRYIKNKQVDRAEDKISSKECRIRYHGFFSKANDECFYYVQARKICLVLDQDSEGYELLPGYKNFKCDFITHREDYVMWQKFRWYRSHPGESTIPVEPTLKDLTINHLQFEMYMSHEPAVQILNHMNIKAFDM